MLRTVKTGLLVAALLGLMTSLAWALTADQVQKRIVNKINSKWRTAGLQVKVVPFNEAETSKGRFKQITVNAKSVVLRDVRLSPVSIGASDVTLDMNMLLRENRVEATKRKSGTFNARLSAGDLNRALAHKKTPIQNLQATLGRGTVTFTGTYKLGLGANLRLEGRLDCPDHYRLNFVPTKASVSGIPLPAGPLKTVLAKMNPLLDFRKIPMNPRINRVIVEPAAITLGG